MFLGFQGWNPNLSDWRFLNGFRLPLNETIVEIVVLELGNTSYSILWFFLNLQF
jgi:hypothetical protein